METYSKFSQLSEVPHLLMLHLAVSLLVTVFS